MPSIFKETLPKIRAIHLLSKYIPLSLVHVFFLFIFFFLTWNVTVPFLFSLFYFYVFARGEVGGRRGVQDMDVFFVGLGKKW
jgi:hypothetical protein